MEFMGISVGVLALVCTAMLVFGARGARKLLGWTFGLLLFGSVGTIVVLCAWPTAQHSTQTPASITFDDLIPKAKPVAILPALPSGFVLDKTADVTDKIQVMGPDKRIFLFAAGTERIAIENYMATQYGEPGTPRAQCWSKEPGPWCDYR